MSISLFLSLIPVLFFHNAFTSDRMPSTESSLQYDPYAGGFVYIDSIFKDNIRSVRFHVQGVVLSMPIMGFSETENLRFYFDDLDGGTKDYYYTVELCNHDWTPNDISAMEYIDGFESNPIYNYNYSSITQSEYTHYNIHLPNENLRITKSGNYVLKVYENNDLEDMVITQRFYVMDKKVDIQGLVKRPSSVLYRNSHQEVDFTVLHKGINLTNPFETINATLMQNGRYETAKIGMKPTFIRDEKLVYDFEDINVFPSTKEFRWLDIQSLRFLDERIKYKEMLLGVQQIYITPDQIRSYDKYFYRKDINGNYYISNEDENDSHLNSDYVNVHFTLPFDNPLMEGNLFVMGDFTNWEGKDYNKMTYNPKRSAYECELSLKQGYYNYMYGFQQNEGGEIDYELIEGYYFDSENDYTIFIYYRPFGERYDALIGVKTLNSYLQ